jgi:hypothetical protein
MSKALVRLARIHGLKKYEGVKPMLEASRNLASDTHGDTVDTILVEHK